MTTYWLSVTLLSDALFGRGDGVAGVVNAEVQHEANGLPYLGGKTIKGMLAATCAEILHALESANCLGQWPTAAGRLFGSAGSTLADAGALHVGSAHLPEDLRLAIAAEVQANRLHRQDVLVSLTSLRRQTAVAAETGAPQQETLRAIRVIQRDLIFVARLEFTRPPQPAELALLAACVKAWRRVGGQRNRGLGRIKADLYATNPFSDPAAVPQTEVWFQPFKRDINRSGATATDDEKREDTPSAPRPAALVEQEVQS